LAVTEAISELNRDAALNTVLGIAGNLPRADRKAVALTLTVGTVVPIDASHN
jgi:hypothetical protein